ncbi:hypothetical protein HY605_01835 [Candidatus Peregrinibacteria bacterium]|nr:hypothetical protein [Candidatus Peregrinibacteria bacterium]
MIKLIQVKWMNGQTELIVQYDKPDSTQQFTTSIKQQAIDERLAKVKNALGGELTNQDIIDAIKAIVNDVRASESKAMNKVNPRDIIGQDLEAR